MELTERERFEGNHFHLFMDIIFRRFQSSHFNNFISIMHGRMDENKHVYVSQILKYSNPVKMEKSDFE